MKYLETFYIDIEQCIIPPDNFSPYMTDRVVTVNNRMKEIMELVLKVSGSKAPVLITGPSGSGKELIAEAIHKHSNRIKDKLIKLNCASIPETLMESEFFGYSSGAFSGAARNGKKGVVELAEGGTLFLDEIGEMPASLQAKLLRFLQDGKFYQVGGERILESDVRIVAATNQDLHWEISSKRFREDLFFRLNVIPIELPDLKSRPEDIPYLVLYFLDHYNKKYNSNKRISVITMEKLCDYPWPGNIRELRNTLERLVLISNDDILTLEDFNFSKAIQPAVMTFSTVEYDTKLSNHESLSDMVTKYELSIINQAINTYGSIRKAAIMLKTSPATLSRKLNHK